MEDRGEAIKSDTGIRRHFTQQVTENHNLPKWCDLFPTAPADAVAAWLHGDKGSMRYYPRRDELWHDEPGGGVFVVVPAEVSEPDTGLPP